jgi:hypothetical protein
MKWTSFMFKSVPSALMLAGIVLLATCAGTIALRLYSLGWRARRSWAVS